MANSAKGALITGVIGLPLAVASAWALFYFGPRTSPPPPPPSGGISVPPATSAAEGTAFDGNEQEQKADQKAKLEVDALVKEAIFPLRWGMTLTEVQNAWGSKPVLSLGQLAKADEFLPLEVRYHHKSLGSTGLIPLSEFVVPCMAGKSDAVAFGSPNLSRISVRLYNDCAGREDVLDRIAEYFGATGGPALRTAAGLASRVAVVRKSSQFTRTVEVLSAQAPLVIDEQF